MKTLMLTVSIAMFSCLALGQNCESLVQDEAGIIRDSNAISASVLVNEGADVKVVTVASIARYGSNLKAVENAYEARCPSWKSPTGGRKANLFVLMVAPRERQKNVFFGDAYKQPLQTEDAVNVIYSHAANPFFANKQWEQGFSAAIKDFAAKIVAFHDQAQHPITPAAVTVTQQPTDFSGLWTVFGWLLL